MSDTQWLIRKFLEDQGRIDVRDANPPMHVINDRLALVDMVLTEVELDDLEGLAVRAMAERTRDLCFAPTSVEAIQAWVDARRAYLEVVKAAYGEK